MFGWVKGKRTYLVGVLMFAVNGLAAAGVITHDQADALFKVLASVGLITLRSAVGK